jgi:hypothetical protein
MIALLHFMKSRALILLSIVIAIFLGLSFKQLAHRGVQMGGDSMRYVGGADRLRNGQPLIEKMPSYLGYITIVRPFRRFESGLKGIVVLQIIIAALAGVTLFWLGKRLGSGLAGLFAATLFLLNSDLTRWHYFILTDSIYISAVVFFTASVQYFVEQPRVKAAAFTILLLTTVLAASIRPNGWLLVPLCLWIIGYKLGVFGVARWRGLIAVTVLTFGIFALWPRTHTGIQAEKPSEMLRRGIVIWGYREWHLNMPADNSATNWTSDVRYVAKHLPSCFKLATTRVGIELLHARSYYSLKHNIKILILVLPVYLLAWIGYRKTRETLLSFILLAVVAGHLFIVAVTFADWDGRFLLYIFPLLGILAGVGLEKLIEAQSEL